MNGYATLPPLNAAELRELRDAIGNQRAAMRAALPYVTHTAEGAEYRASLRVLESLATLVAEALMAAER